MRRISILGAVALLSLAGGALAQNAPAQTSPSQPAASSTQAATDGIKMADTATVAVRFVTMKPADLMSSKLIGAKVYNNQNESIGNVEDLVIDNGKTISGVVVSAGGFLGLGEHYVLIDPSSIVLNRKDGSLRAFIDTSKENLKNAPKFEYSKNKT
jgi:sporulation protein YlmC with PRC-barrel domain